MGSKTYKPDPAFRSPMTQAEIEQLDEHISMHEVRVQWFSTVHQQQFSLRVSSYDLAAKLVSTLDFNRTCHIRLVNELHQVIYSFH